MYAGKKGWNNHDFCSSLGVICDAVSRLAEMSVYQHLDWSLLILCTACTNSVQGVQDHAVIESVRVLTLY